MLHDIYDRFIKKAQAFGLDREELVFGEGDPNSKIMLVGEAPGKDEVKNKRPFCGKAGKILDDFLLSTGLKREELFITNTVKLRPYKLSAKGIKSNRPPNKAEKELCEACLFEEIAFIKPKFVVTLGNTALRAVLKEDKINIGNVHGTLIDCGSFLLFALYHPASMIYRRELESAYRADLEKLKSHLA